MNLYQIDREILALQNPETGEIEDLEKLEALIMDKDHKMESVALYIKNLSADAAALSNEIKQFQKRLEACERQKERLSNYLAAHVGPVGFESPKCAVSVRTSKRVEVEDDAFVVQWLEMSGRSDGVLYGKPKPMKTYLHKLIDSGIEVPKTRIQEYKGVTVK